MPHYTVISESENVRCINKHLPWFHYVFNIVGVLSAFGWTCRISIHMPHCRNKCRQYSSKRWVFSLKKTLVTIVVKLATSAEIYDNWSVFLATPIRHLNRRDRQLWALNMKHLSTVQSPRLQTACLPLDSALWDPRHTLTPSLVPGTLASGDCSKHESATRFASNVLRTCWCYELRVFPESSFWMYRRWRFCRYGCFDLRQADWGGQVYSRQGAENY